MNYINLNGNISLTTKTIASHVLVQTKTVSGDIHLDLNNPGAIPINLNGNIGFNNKHVRNDIDFASTPPEYPRYTGPYEVIPEIVAQVLTTKDKVMRDDVTVLEIPYFETSNPQGGETVYIGSSLDGN